MASFVQIQPLFKNPMCSCPPSLKKNPWSNWGRTTLNPRRRFGSRHWIRTEKGRRVTCRREKAIFCCAFVDPWAPIIDSESIASQLFAVSLFPYLGFLYFITKSKSAPRLTLFGFYFLLTFVGATIPAGIYAKVHYGTSLSNVDWLHGGAESLLTLTNIFIVLGLREGLRRAGNEDKKTSNLTSEVKDEETSSV